MQLHNYEQKGNTKQLFKIKYLKPYVRNIVNTLNYSTATNRNEHAFQLLFVPLESIIYKGAYATGQQEHSGRQNDEKMSPKIGNAQSPARHIFSSFRCPESSRRPVA